MLIFPHLKKQWFIYLILHFVLTLWHCGLSVITVALVNSEVATIICVYAHIRLRKLDY